MSNQVKGCQDGDDPDWYISCAIFGYWMYDGMAKPLKTMLKESFYYLELPLILFFNNSINYQVFSVTLNDMIVTWEIQFRNGNGPVSGYHEMEKKDTDGVSYEANNVAPKGGSINEHNRYRKMEDK